MAIRSVFALLSLTVILLMGCKKNDSSPLPPTATSLLSRNWKQNDILLTANGMSQSVFSQQQACQTDNIYTFNTDGSVNVNEGATKCNAADPDIAATGTWQLQNSNTKLSITYNTTGNRIFTLESLSATDLIISDTMTVSGFLTKGTLYFKAQ